MSGQYSRSNNRPGRSAWPFLAALMAAVALLAAACSSPGAPGPVRPATAAASTGPGEGRYPARYAGRGPAPVAHRGGGPPARVRARWYVPTSTQPSWPRSARTCSTRRCRQWSASSCSRIQASELSTVVAIVSADGAVPRAQILLTVDSRGLISVLRISPANTGPTPATWADVDAALHLVAPQVRLLVADVSNGSCQPVHSIDPATAAPLGSAFKLYVLDALGNAVAAGKVGWNQPLTVTAQFKGLPPGDLQNEPDGTQISVLDTAAKMISVSDNTATDMLINLVGRSAVEAALTATGMASPALDRPFLTTREIFILKLDQWPALAKRYSAADEPHRRALLAGTVDRAPLPPVAAAGAWTTPRDINSLEYFASASDICRAYASLAALARRPGLSPIGQVISLNDDGLQLDPAQWKTTWFKGGSEPGVLTLAYLATTRTGRSYVVTVLAENPSQPIDETTAIPVILSAIKGAFTLAAHR